MSYFVVHYVDEKGIVVGTFEHDDSALDYINDRIKGDNISEWALIKGETLELEVAEMITRVGIK